MQSLRQQRAFRAWGAMRAARAREPEDIDWMVVAMVVGSLIALVAVWAWVAGHWV